MSTRSKGSFWTPQAVRLLWIVGIAAAIGTILAIAQGILS